MSPGEGIGHLFSPHLQKELEMLIPDEVVKELRKAMRPLESLQNDFQAARTEVRRRVLAEVTPLSDFLR